MRKDTIKVPVLNKAGDLLEEIEVAEAAFGGRVCKDVLRQAVLTYEANQRAGTAKTKTRGELSYSSKKPWRQKHTGRARAGTRASPIWAGGGRIFGPAPRDYSKKLNKKMRRKALASAVLAKLRAGQVRILESLELAEPKTKEMAQLLKALGVERRFLLVLPQHDATVWRCTRNLPGATVLTAAELNAYQVLQARDLILTKEAFDQVVSAGQQDAAQASSDKTASPAEDE